MTIIYRVIMVVVGLFVGYVTTARAQSTHGDCLKADQYYYRGMQAVAQGEHDEARALLEHSYRLCPTSAEVAHALGNECARINAYDRALGLLRQAYSSDSTNRSYMESLVSILASRQQTSEAVVILEYWMANNPTDEGVERVLGNLYFQNGGYDKALALYDRLQRANKHLFSEYTRLSFTKAMIYEAQNKPELAERELSRLVSAFPEEVDAKLGVINYLNERKRYPQMKGYVEALVRHDVSKQMLRELQMLYYVGINDTAQTLRIIQEHSQDKQISTVEKVSVWYKYLLSTSKGDSVSTEHNPKIRHILEQNPDDTKAVQIYADLLRKQRKFAEAITIIRPLLKTIPEDAELWNGIISDAISLEDEKLLAELCLEAIKHIDTEWRYYYFASIGLYTSRRVDEAVRLLERGIRMIPSDNDAGLSMLYGQLGDIYSVGKLKDRTKAYAYYEKSLEHNSDNPDVLNNYAYHLAEEGQDLDKAERMAARGVKLDADNYNLLDTYAWIFYKMGNYSLADLYQRKAIDKAGDNATGVMYEHLGDIYQARNDGIEAMQAWQRAIELYKKELTDPKADPEHLREKKQRLAKVEQKIQSHQSK